MEMAILALSRAWFPPALGPVLKIEGENLVPRESEAEAQHTRAAAAQSVKGNFQTCNAGRAGAQPHPSHGRPRPRSTRADTPIRSSHAPPLTPLHLSPSISVQSMSWYYGLDGRTQGPVEEAVLEKLSLSDAIECTTPLWRTGMSAW